MRGGPTRLVILIVALSSGGCSLGDDDRAAEDAIIVNPGAAGLAASKYSGGQGIGADSPIRADPTAEPFAVSEGDLPPVSFTDEPADIGALLQPGGS